MFTGEGSCLETLEKRKLLVVNTNVQSMTNCQLELAKLLHKDGHLFSTCSTLPGLLQSTDLSTPKCFPAAGQKNSAFLDKIVGL
ncbi:UDP-N-acetylglucosamine transferase subunit ALG13-like [Saccopteryx bilineata]|uniref:UDP-N-acetylglucosamine transferase subunit ALG13-like n=1 Tax=Saccopteryx bilineata TaxID=59482 RepID=UPI00338DF4A9